MAHDEYQIPQNYNESEIRAQINDIQSSAQPEQEPIRYQFIKDIEEQVFAVREVAIKTEAKSPNWLHGIVITPKAPTLHELIEQESKLGGKIFGDGNKFWLDEKSQTLFHKDGVDWYHQRFNPANPKHPTVLRFQTTASSIHKIYEGREYSVTQEDINNLIDAVTAYPAAIAPLYPDVHTV